MRDLGQRHAGAEHVAGREIALAGAGNPADSTRIADFLIIGRHDPTVTYMMDKIDLGALRRTSPRVGVETFCTELQEDMMRHAIVTDLSSEGLRILRPIGGRSARTLPVEFEIPDIDEVVWALAEVCFDEIQRAPKGCIIGTGGLVRSTGLRVVSAAERHKRILREFVMDSWCEIDFDSEFAQAPAINDNHLWLMNASCYRS